MNTSKAVVLAGGQGLRIQELTRGSHKGLLKVGDFSLLELIISHLAQAGIAEVLIAAGHNYAAVQSHFNNNPSQPPVTVYDTGTEVDTGGRIGKVLDWVAGERFILTWCDGLSNIDFSAMEAQHAHSGRQITLAAVHPPARFGELTLVGDKVADYREKPLQQQRWISGGYFVVEASIAELISGPRCSWERDILPAVAENDQLGAYRHPGAWLCVDNQQELQNANSLDAQGLAFWPKPEVIAG